MRNTTRKLPENCHKILLSRTVNGECPGANDYAEFYDDQTLVVLYGLLRKQFFYLLVDAQTFQWRVYDAIEHECRVNEHSEPNDLQEFKRFPAEP